MEVRDLQEVIDEIIVMKDELENCQYSISDPDFARMYTAIMWPGTLNSAIAETEEKLEARENQFLAEMEGEQMVFARSLKDIAETVESFGSFTDLAQVVKVSANAVAISEKLAELVRSPFDGWWVSLAIGGFWPTTKYLSGHTAVFCLCLVLPVESPPIAHKYPPTCQMDS